MEETEGPEPQGYAGIVEKETSQDAPARMFSLLEAVAVTPTLRETRLKGMLEEPYSPSLSADESGCEPPSEGATTDGSAYGSGPVPSTLQSEQPMGTSVARMLDSNISGRSLPRVSSATHNFGDDSPNSQGRESSSRRAAPS